MTMQSLADKQTNNKTYSLKSLCINQISHNTHKTGKKTEPRQDIGQGQKTTRQNALFNKTASRQINERIRQECSRQDDPALPMPPGYPYPKLAAIPDLVDGYPACWWFEYPERLRHLNIDQKGMGVRAEALPDALRPFSLNGWVVKLVDGKLEIFAGRNGVSNEQAVRAYMEDCQDKIIEALGEVGEAQQ